MNQDIQLLKRAAFILMSDLSFIHFQLENLEDLKDAKFREKDLKSLDYALQLLLLEDTSKMKDFYPVQQKINKMLIKK